MHVYAPQVLALSLCPSLQSAYTLMQSTPFPVLPPITSQLSYPMRFSTGLDSNLCRFACICQTMISHVCVCVCVLCCLT